MTKITSFYLDLLRVAAALGVFFVHCNLSWFSNGQFLPDYLGHKLVMVFFVLSGYLIAFSTIGKDKGIKRYFVDRFSRLYSVVIPALILTYALDAISRHFNPDLFAYISPAHQYLKAILNLLFISQIWDLCSRPSSNGPFWSLSYEFWYYFLFGIAFYLKGYKRIIGILLTLLLIGPKIILLLPVWAYGVLCYYLTLRTSIKSTFAAVLFVLSLLGIIILTFTNTGEDMSKFGVPPLYFSTFFYYDWLFGILVALNLFAVSFMKFTLPIPVYIVKSTEYLSSISFSLYLYHVPLMTFAAAIIPYNKTSLWQLWAVMAVILSCIGLLAHYTESQRYLYKTLFGNLLNFVEKKYRGIATPTISR